LTPPGRVDVDDDCHYHDDYYYDDGVSWIDDPPQPPPPPSHSHRAYLDDDGDECDALDIDAHRRRSDI
jgi:hypothetical protein